MDFSKALFDQSVIYKVLYKEAVIQQQYFIFQHVEEAFLFLSVWMKICKGILTDLQ